jgi:hypothetical protein
MIFDGEYKPPYPTHEETTHDGHVSRNTTSNG